VLADEQVQQAIDSKSKEINDRIRKGFIVSTLIVVGSVALATMYLKKG